MLPPGVIAPRVHSVGAVVAEPNSIAIPNHLIKPGGPGIEVVGECGKQMYRHVIEGRAITNEVSQPRWRPARRRNDHVLSSVYRIGHSPTVTELAATMLFPAWEAADSAMSNPAALTLGGSEISSPTRRFPQGRPSPARPHTRRTTC